MARRGLQAYAVPSAQAGQHTDPSARRDALSGLMTGGFLMAVIAAVLAIVVATPEYALPAAGASEPSLGLDVASAAPAVAADWGDELPTSESPDKLKGYKWPVKGGTLANYYDWDKQGLFSIGGQRMHPALDITWFEGAKVKAAHKGTVVAAGRDWLKHIGFEDSMQPFYKRFDKKGKKSKRGRKGRKGGASEATSGKGDSGDGLPLGVVVDDGNGYRSVYSNLKNITVKKGDKVKAGSVIGEMARGGGRQFMRYQLVRMDGLWMMVAKPGRQLGYPNYTRERVDPLVVLNLDAKRSPLRKRQPPKDPPRLSDY